ncbi:glucosamine inositolphosphorylceramide transferase family protein [Alkalisalibacterium limincola]|uniref:Glucosamine inositolphosphorylceramide transferase 1 N-terminal domain-containing protein n=1 Tax=Alkalisalibacterium limincola TaxID=2699169 RepID=A0A5C8KXY9_9GAMM|nr:hypothetical protein [Alkalisalibacterium limincola]TXK64463.1 hypothetical protein FU658_06120 [Alkalisalibacterium limincola]
MNHPASPDLYPPFTGAALRVLVLLGVDEAPAWLVRMLHDLGTSRHVKPAFVRVSGPSPPPRLGPVFRAYLRLERITVGSMAAVFTPTALPADMLEHHATGALDASGRLGLDQGTLDRIGQCSPDLILAVGLARPARELAALARHGAWTLEPDACDPLASGAWMLDAFARGDTTTVAGLCVHDSTRGAWRLLEPVIVSPPRLSFSRHRAYQLQKAPAQLLRALRRLAEGTGLRWVERPEPMRPHAVNVIALLGRLGIRATRSILQRARGIECWMVAVQRRSAHLDPEAPKVGEVRRLKPPTGWFWADPFPWREDGGDWVMIEALDYRNGRGEIQALELDESLAVRRVHPVMRVDHHLSYPFVFRWSDATWMVVESSAARRTTLYRCEQFPDRWVPEGDVLPGCRIVDTTLCEHEGRWWLFGCISESPFDDGGRESNELFVFHATSPRGPWTPHPCNPVCSDVSRARPAGPLFRHGSRLIRPSQDGSIEYGRAVQFNHIVTLTPEAYEERPLGRLAGDWHPGLRGCHTYAFSDGLMAIDGKFSAPRSHARPSHRKTEIGHAT